MQKNFKESRNFYKDINFKELKLSENISYFKIYENLGFYLQNANVKDWVDNSMIFLEVDNIENYLSELKDKQLTIIYPKIRLSEIVDNSWEENFFFTTLQ